MIYPKVLQMIDRKQEKERRIRGSLIVSDLLKTQAANVLTSKEFSKIFLILARDNFFLFRSNMAESLGFIIKKKKPDDGEQGSQPEENDFGITIEQFEEQFSEELADLINDSDNQVRIMAFKSIGRLIYHDDNPNVPSYLRESHVKSEVIPPFLKLLESVLDDEESTQKLSKVFGEILYAINSRFPHIVKEN